MYAINIVELGTTRVARYTPSASNVPAPTTFTLDTTSIGACSPTDLGPFPNEVCKTNLYVVTQEKKSEEQKKKVMER